MRPQTSTVFIVAGPNARRPGVQPHAGHTNPHHQALTETQAEGFIAIENNADVVTEQLAAGSAQSPTKQTKKPGPKPGFKRRKSVAFTATSDIDASPTAVSPRKRGKRAPATDERGDEPVIVPTLDPSTTPQIAPIPTEDSLAAIETGNESGSVKTSADDNMNGDIDEHVEDNVVEPAKAAAAEVPVNFPSKTSAKSLTKAPKKASTKSSARQSTTDGIKVHITDRLGRKRVRDSRGKFH